VLAFGGLTAFAWFEEDFEGLLWVSGRGGAGGKG
jgi:hypothetical protein